MILALGLEEAARVAPSCQMSTVLLPGVATPA